MTPYTGKPIELQWQVRHRRVAAAIESRDPTAAEENAALIDEHLEASAFAEHA
jgi:DNA-binding FadR family transcriptional regulator